MISDHLRPVFPLWGIVGFRMIWRGKINIAGNGRTRTLMFTAGGGPRGAVAYRTAYEYTVIRTFTGAIGVHL